MINQFIFLIANALFRILPMKRQIVFVCFEGRQYGDNPRRIAEYVHSVLPDLRLYWVVDERSKDKPIPIYLHKVLNNSLRYAWIKNRSKIIVSNGAGVMLSILSGKKKIYKPFIKKKNQLELATWHGTPLKHIGADIPGSKYTEETLFSSANVLIASSEYERKVFERAFLNRIPVDVLGYARNDYLYQKNNIDEVKEKLGIPKGKKVALFAPTYRDDNITMSGLNQLASIIPDKLFSSLASRFNGEWVLVYRFHNLVVRAPEMGKYIGKERFINGNLSDDMADYLSVSDLLITDYSGSMFDVVGSNVKCILWVPDLREYEDNRGMYLEIDRLPFPIAKDFNELINCILYFDEENYIKNVGAFKERIGSANDGFSAKRIFDKYIRQRV